VRLRQGCRSEFGLECPNRSQTLTTKAAPALIVLFPMGANIGAVFTITWRRGAGHRTSSVAHDHRVTSRLPPLRAGQGEARAGGAAHPWAIDQVGPVESPLETQWGEPLAAAPKTTVAPANTC